MELKKDVSELPVVVGKTPMERYSCAVAIGKKLVGSHKVIQVQMAHLATQVCTIRHGGISNGIYTIKQFAKDIGFNPKTLQDYVAIYRSVIKVVGISPEKCTLEQWRAASKVRRTHEFENTNNRKIVGTPSCKRGEVERTPEEIKTEFHKHMNGEISVSHKLHNWNSELLFIANNISKISDGMTEKDSKVLGEMFLNALYIKDFCSKRMTELQNSTKK